MKKIVIYTCITNNYDWLLPPLSMPQNVDYVCYTDSFRGNKNGWQVRPIPENLSSLPYSLVNRYFKFFPHNFFADYDWSIYIDGNLRILNDLSTIIDQIYQEGEVIGCPAHPDRSTIIEEVPVCKSLGKFSIADLGIIDTQIHDYLTDGMPENQPLTENNFIVRKHSDPRVQELMESWWENLERYTKRDQISFPYVVWKSGLSVKKFKFAASVDNFYIKKVNHRKQGSKLLVGKSYIRARKIDGVFWRFINFKFEVLSSLLKKKRRLRKDKSHKVG
jgi:hypothetical protein